MEKEKIFPDRVKDPIPAAKTDSFFSSSWQTRLPRDEVLTNPHFLGDERAQRFSNLWFSQRQTATIVQKEKVGIIFITEVLGLNKEIARKFANGDRSAFNSVGIKQIAIPKGDLTNFWREVKAIFPDSYGEEDISFLTKCGINAVTHFLGQVETPGAEKAIVLQLLAKAAQIYK